MIRGRYIITSTTLIIDCFVNVCVYSLQNEARRSHLFCRYQDGKRNPRLLLQPIREEDEWDSPHIVRYLDVLSEAEVAKIKQLAKPRVGTSGSGGATTWLQGAAHIPSCSAPVHGRLL